MTNSTLTEDVRQLREIFDEDTLVAIETGVPVLFKPSEEKLIRRTLDRLERLVKGASAGGSATGRPTGRNGGRKPKKEGE